MKKFIKSVINKRLLVIGEIDSITRVLINVMAIMAGVSVANNMFGILRAVSGR